MYSMCSLQESQNVIQIFTVDLDFDRCMVSSLKHSSCAVEHMRVSLNLLLNQFDQFKVNLFVPGAGWRLTQRDKRLLTVVSLLFGVGGTNCSQGNLLIVIMINSFRYQANFLFSIRGQHCDCVHFTLRIVTGKCIVSGSKHKFFCCLLTS